MGTELETWEEIGWEGYAAAREEFHIQRDHRNFPLQLNRSAPTRPYLYGRSPYSRRERPTRYHLQISCSCGRVFYDAAKQRVLYRAEMHRNRCDGDMSPALIPAPRMGRKPRR